MPNFKTESHVVCGDLNCGFPRKLAAFTHARIFAMSNNSAQPKLFESNAETADISTVLLYALGEFQSRGHKLADRELALDRLHMAFVRACSRFGMPDIPDEAAANGLRDLGAAVTEIPAYFAKRPFRIKISAELCRRATEIFAEAKK